METVLPVPILSHPKEAINFTNRVARKVIKTAAQQHNQTKQNGAGIVCMEMCHSIIRRSEKVPVSEPAINTLSCSIRAAPFLSTANAISPFEPFHYNLGKQYTAVVSTLHTKHNSHIPNAANVTQALTGRYFSAPSLKSSRIA